MSDVEKVPLHSRDASDAGGRPFVYRRVSKQPRSGGGVSEVQRETLTSGFRLSRGVARSGESAAQILAVWDALGPAFGDVDEVLIAPMPTEAQDRERWESLVATLIPDAIPRPVELLQARRSAAMRRDMLAEHGFYSAEEIADLRGSRARNRYALAARWASHGRIFGVPLGGKTVYPAFQFDPDHAPLPIVRRVLDTLPRDRMSAWAVALWWYANQAGLPGEASPVQLLGGEHDPELVAAAGRLADPLPL